LLNGTADPAEIARHAPTIDGFDTEPAVLEGMELVQVLYEIDSGSSEALLPPGLHPTVPPVVRWSFYRIAESPWGPFQLAQTRIECRSGLRHRSYLLGGLIDNATAAGELTRRWAFRVVQGELGIERGYYETRAWARRQGRAALDVALRDPVPLGVDDVQFIASMHAANTPRGLRLIQCEPIHELERVERGKPEVIAFDPGAFGDADVRPVYPISAVLCLGRATLPRLRFVCRADVSAFAGTESVGA
jgi:hypothetical protein